jgi:uncharacterized membrane protein required for colicin V production
MITFTIIASVVSFIGGVYVGVRYSDKLLDIWESIIG